jgi:putative ABC transport system permease protein
MEIVKGRDFSTDFTTDVSNAYIVNETAVNAMGMKNPVGKKLAFWGRKGTIIGVVKDFHYKSLHKEIEPLVLRIAPRLDLYIFVKTKSENISKTLNYIQRTYGKFNPGYPFEFTFLDDEIDKLYNDDRRTLKIFNYFTFIAIFISCLGLFGLAAFMAQLRTKEVGVRRVLGAPIPNIVLLLSKEFLALVVFANIFAWPIAYIVMNKWLHNFAYRTTPGYLTFILSALLALVIALATVIYQSIKAATINPVDALKYE